MSDRIVLARTGVKRSILRIAIGAFARSSDLRRLFVGLALAFACLAAAAQSPPPEKRIALVIGNARYAAVPLNNPENDARLMAANLRELGFEVAEHLNLNVRDFRRVLRDFARRMQDEEGAAVFYYAGHGVQIDGRNYLLPVDINLRDQEEVKDDSVDVDELFISRIEKARSKARIVILDACRDNPFAGRTRQVKAAGGLAEMNARGTLIAFSSAPGAPAEDGEPGANSVYTGHLAREMMKEGLEVEQMFKNVRVNVLRDTKERQVPWVNTSLTVNFSFNPGKGGVIGPQDAGARDKVLALEYEIEKMRKALGEAQARQSNVDQVARDLDATRRQLEEARAAAARAAAQPTQVASVALPSAAAPLKRSIEITLEADQALNTDRRNTSAPVALRVYTLRASTAFQGADFLSLFERDRETLGGDIVSREEVFLRPGQTLKLQREIGGEARVVAVFAAFREFDRASWRAVGTIPDAGGDTRGVPLSLRVRAGAREIQVAGGG